jgi:transposase-like protein
MYPIVYFDALRLKIRDDGTVKNKAVYLALGIRADGRKEVLGLWIEHTFPTFAMWDVWLS